MILNISTKTNDVKISNINDFNIFGWNEYKMNFDIIKVKKNVIEKDNIHLDKILLMHFTHINNIWHLMHHLFICYKYMKKKNIKVDIMYPIFFNSFIERQGDLSKARYNEIMYSGMGFNFEMLKKINKHFSEDKSIYVRNIEICHNEPLNFRNEPLMDDFKNYIFKNMKIERKNYNDKQILFILRRGTREITNIDFVKKELDANIKYVYLEDIQIKEQIELYANADIVIGVHGAGLAWCVFMKKKSLLLEMYPGNSNTDNYIRWCNIANVYYKRMSVQIKSGNVREFRKTTVYLDINNINMIKNIIKN